MSILGLIGNQLGLAGGFWHVIGALNAAGDADLAVIRADVGDFSQARSVAQASPRWGRAWS